MDLRFGKTFRRAAGILAAAAVLSLAPVSAAQALPPERPGQSVIITYFNHDRTVAIGGSSYGYCMPNFSWGETSGDMYVQLVTCAID